MALITYIGHSGFLVEWEHSVWLFDYYRGDIPEFSHEKKLFVFCSHKHADHFNPEIFSRFEEYPDVSYLLSRDLSYQVKRVSLSDRQNERITFLKAYQSHREADGAGGDIRVRTPSARRTAAWRFWLLMRHRHFENRYIMREISTGGSGKVRRNRRLET